MSIWGGGCRRLFSGTQVQSGAFITLPYQTTDAPFPMTVELCPLLAWPLHLAHEVGAARRARAVPSSSTAESFKWYFFPEGCKSLDVLAPAQVTWRVAASEGL